MDGNFKVEGEILSLYSLKTKQTLENIKQLQSQLKNLSSSAESDEEDEDCKATRSAFTPSKTISNLPNSKTKRKRGSKMKKETFKTDAFENSLILEDEINDYVSVGEKYGKNNNMSNDVDVDKVYSVDSPVTCSVTDNEESLNKNNNDFVTSSVVFLDDAECFSTGIVYQNVLNTVGESVTEQPTRRSKRLRSTRNNVDDSVIVIDGPISTRTRRNKRRTRTGRSTCNVESNIPVITFDEDYEIPQCSYYLPNHKSMSLLKNGEDADKSINYDATSETVTVFVSWRAKDCEKFEIPRYRPLKGIFEHYAEKESIPVACVVLTKDSDLLTPKDTPDSADFKCVQFLQGFKANVEQNFENKISKPVVLGENDIELKVLLQNKRPLMLTVKKNQPMKVIMAKCAAQLECPEEEVVLFLDGDKVDLTNTPEDLDLQSGDCVDAHVKKS